MKDNKLIYILLFILPGLLMLACSQDDIDLPGNDESDDIIFHVSMPGVEVGSRSYDNIQMGNLVGGFSVTAMNLDSLINESQTEIKEANYAKTLTNKIDLYFKDKLVERTEGMGDAFRGDGCRWPNTKNEKDGLVQFFAFYPSVETLKSKLVISPTDKTNYFDVHHPTGATQSEKRDTGYWFNYRMGNYLINRDISTHSDFVAASVRGSKTNNLYSGVKLNFQHKLCRVDLKAWGNNPSYDIEIAGVKIGGVIIKSTYNLAGNWIHGSATKDYVEYIFNEGDDKVKRAADQIITIGSGKHSSQNASVSIMGNGGYALLIPHQTSTPSIWNHTGDATNKQNGMYFSVLMRIIDKTDNQGLILYPYVDNALITGTTVKASNKNSVYLVVEKATATVKGRVYKDTTTKKYYSDKALTTDYTVPEGMEIREYGWAAIPCRATWTIGRTYTYTLNYSGGVGVHEPGDDAPGKPIITQFAVGVSENEGVWKMVMDYENEERELKKDDFTQE